MKWLALFLGLTSIALSQSARPTPFAPDSALVLLRELSVDIGPRPMGSPAERRALSWAADRLRAAGVDEVQVMEIRATPPGMKGRVRNTRSGVTVGTLRGESERIIVIGAHIDSASPEIPGTNDDGSGTAVVLELARVMSQREWHHTIVFCLFGGEEGGLVGSRAFVDAYDHLDRVDMMLQVDMANGVEDLGPFIDKGTTQTPSWLFLAAQEELLSMGYDGLAYPFHFFTWNIASGSGASSDHEPFLVRGIPAIDFTTDPSDPIHTPQDSWEWFRPGGLERSGDLIHRLVERFDREMPEERTGSYVTMPVGSTFLLIPTWTVWTFVAAAILLSFVVTLMAWSSRTERRPSPRPRVPGLKVFAALMMIWAAVWSAENFVALLSGWRSPWYGNPWLVVLPAAAVALAALILVAQWTRRWNLSNDPVRYKLRATVWFTLLTAGAAVLSPRLAAYFAWGLLFTVGAWLIRPTWIRIGMIVVGAYPAVRLLTPDLFPFIARTFGQIPAHGLLAESALTAVLALICTLVALPYAFGALAVVRDPSLRWPMALSYRRPLIVWTFVGIAVLSVGAASLAEPYSAARPRSVKLTSTLNEGKDSASTVIESTDWLRDLVVLPEGGDTVRPGSTGRFELSSVPARVSDWLRVESTDWISTDTGAVGSGLLTCSYDREAIRLQLTITPDRASIVSVTGGVVAVNRSEREADVVFEPPAPSGQSVPLSVRLSSPDTITVAVEAMYAALPRAVAVEGAPINVVPRTVVRASRRIFIPSSSHQP